MPTILTGKNVFEKPSLKIVEKINLVALHVSPIFKVTSKPPIQYIIFFVKTYEILGQAIYLSLSKCSIFHLYIIINLCT